MSRSSLQDILDSWGETYHSVDIRTVTCPMDPSVNGTIDRRAVLSVVRFCRESRDEIERHQDELKRLRGSVDLKSLTISLSAVDWRGDLNIIGPLRDVQNAAGLDMNLPDQHGVRPSSRGSWPFASGFAPFDYPRGSGFQGTILTQVLGEKMTRELLRAGSPFTDATIAVCELFELQHIPGNVLGVYVVAPVYLRAAMALVEQAARVTLDYDQRPTGARLYLERSRSGLRSPSERKGPIEPKGERLADGIARWEYEFALDPPLGDDERVRAHLVDSLTAHELWEDSVTKPAAIPTEAGTVQEQQLSRSDDSKRRVFVVHGHDVGLREQVCRVLEKIELQPVVLQDLPGRNRTLMEKLEGERDAGFAVVLVTGDDEGRKRGSNEAHRPRARQNVILELGYFLGSLGRDRVAMLYQYGTELPSDLSGVQWIEADPRGAWKFKLGGELRAAGLFVDLNRLQP